MSNHVNINLKSIKLDGLDIIHGFDECVIYEDIFQNEMSGYIIISETESIREYFEGLPNGIIGEETFSITFASRFPDGTEHETVTFKMWVHKLQDYTPNTSAQKRYKLHFVSENHKKNASHRNRKIWEGTADSIVSQIVSAQLGGNLVQVDSAKYSNEYIFPNWTPYQVANYLAANAISASHNDPRYLFYEDRKGLNFVTLSYLMKKGPSLTIDQKMFKEGDKDINRLNIQVAATKTLFDNMVNMYSGMYGNTLITWDKINKKFEETTQTYTGTWGQFEHVGETKLTKRMQESPKNKFQFMSINEPNNPGVFTHTDEWVRQLLNRSNQSRNNVFTITFTGYTNLHLGDVIKWDMKSTKDDGSNPDIRLSGKYLVSRIKHVIRKDNYDTVFEAVKDGYLS